MKQRRNIQKGHPNSSIENRVQSNGKNNDEDKKTRISIQIPKSKTKDWSIHRYRPHKKLLMMSGAPHVTLSSSLTVSDILLVANVNILRILFFNIN